MKNSKTKKLLATIALTSMSFNTNLVLAGPKLKKGYLAVSDLSNIYQYIKPEDKQKFPLISKKCEDVTKTGNFADQWCMLLNILKYEDLKEYVDKNHIIPVIFVEKYFRNYLKKVYPDNLAFIVYNFIEKIHNSTETYCMLDSSKRQDLEDELSKINPLFKMCMVGKYVIVPIGNRIESSEFNINEDDINKLRKLVIEYCNTNQRYNFFDCIDIQASKTYRILEEVNLSKLEEVNLSKKKLKQKLSEMFPEREISMVDNYVIIPKIYGRYGDVMSGLELSLFHGLFVEIYCHTDQTNIEIDINKYHDKILEYFTKGEYTDAVSKYLDSFNDYTKSLEYCHSLEKQLTCPESISASTYDYYGSDDNSLCKCLSYQELKRVRNTAMIDIISAKYDYHFDKNTRTVTICGTTSFPINITPETVKEIINKTGSKSTNKINLILENCVVKEDAFYNRDFINDLIIKDGSIVEAQGFSKAQITNVIIENGVTTQNDSFWKTIITGYIRCGHALK